MSRKAGQDQSHSTQVSAGVLGGPHPQVAGLGGFFILFSRQTDTKHRYPRRF